jgi:hypothetical protein
MKPQVPNSKFQGSFQPQFSRGGNVRFGIGDLEFPWNLELGVWNL